MKKFETIPEWLKSNPDEKLIQKVLTLINKKSQATIKKEMNKKLKLIEQKEKELEVLKSSIKDMEETIGLNGPDEAPIKPRKPRQKK